MRSGILSYLATIDWYSDHLGRLGRGSTILGTAGLLTTQNLLWFSGVVLGAATLAAQVWFEWYRQRRRAYIDTEAYKARMRRDLEKEGIDSKTIRALQQSPDPDSGD